MFMGHEVALGTTSVSNKDSWNWISDFIRQWADRNSRGLAEKDLVEYGSPGWGSGLVSHPRGWGEDGTADSSYPCACTLPKTSSMTVSSCRFWPCSDGALTSQRYFPASFLVTFLIRMLKSIISARSLKSPFLSGGRKKTMLETKQKTSCIACASSYSIQN